MRFYIYKRRALEDRKAERDLEILGQSQLSITATCDTKCTTVNVNKSTKTIVNVNENTLNKDNRRQEK